MLVLCPQMLFLESVENNDYLHAHCMPLKFLNYNLQIQCHEVLLEDVDPIKGIIDYVNRVGVEILILGAAAKGGLLRYIYAFLFCVHSCV